MAFVSPNRKMLLAVALVMVLSQVALGQTGTADAVDALSDNGFENIRCVEDSARIVYTVENNVYRLQPSGVAAALKIIDEKYGPSDKRQKVVIFTDLNVPKLALSSGVDGQWSASNRGYEKQWRMVRRQRRTNSSFGDIDIVVYPQVYLKNLIVNQIYQVLFELSPAVEVTLWPGAKLTGQVIIPIYNDGYTGEYKNIRPGYITLQQAFRLPWNSWGDVRVGVFDMRTYGVEANATLPLGDGRHWYLSGKAGVVGIGMFMNFNEFWYSGSRRIYCSVGPDFYWNRYNVQFKARAERLLMGDMGFSAEMFRHFKYCSVGFYARKTWKKGVNIDLNGGFRFYVALPPYRYRRYGKVPRVTTGFSTGLTYNAGNEKTYHVSTVSLADDSPMKQNQFNAGYVQTYMRETKNK